MCRATESGPPYFIIFSRAKYFRPISLLLHIIYHYKKYDKEVTLIKSKLYTTFFRWATAIMRHWCYIAYSGNQQST